MSLLGTTAGNQMLDGLGGTVSATNVLAYVSAHSASPGTTGANELSGGGYARQACSWSAASGGSKTNTSSLTINTDGVTAVPYFGTNSASTSGTFGKGLALTTPVTAASITIAPGALTITVS